MYLRHFGLADKPFRVVPSPRFLFASDTHDEGRARILYGIRESRGFVVVTGAVGLGKTTVMLSVLDQLDTHVRAALIFNPVADFVQLLRAIAFEFGIDADGRDEVSLLRDLNLFLVERLAAGETCVLLVDEAQNLSIDLLERLRTLSNLQTEESSLLQIVLVGQPELVTKLENPSLLQLRQRIGVWYEVKPLDARDTCAYIHHRLRLAGSRVPEHVIDRVTAERVHHYADGVPRVINQICDTSMVIAFGRDADRVRREHVDEAAAELRLVEPLPSSPAERHPVEANGAETAKDHARLSVALAAVVVLAVLLGIWHLSGWGLGEGPRSDRGIEIAEARSAEPGAGMGVSEVDSAGPDAAAKGKASATPGPGPSASAGALAREDGRGQVQRWLEGGRRLYAAHLASFQSADGARRFVDEILQRFPEWPQPFFIVETESGDGWFRVLSGGFPDREAARDWIGVAKDEYGLGFAQLSRLDRRAEAVSSHDGLVGEQTGVMR